MKRFCIAFFCLAGLALALETTVHVLVPARMIPGESPILVLEGVTLGEDEGATIQVLVSDSAGEKVVLGSAGTVGNGRSDAWAGPPHKTTLLVPLNQRAVRLLTGRHDTELILRVRNNPSRPPLKVDRIYFQEK